MNTIFSRNAWLLAITLFIIQGCSRNPSGSRIEQEEDIKEAVLIHLIKPRVQNQSSVSFVEINGGDPSPQFLKRIANPNFNVKPASESSWKDGQAIDSSTGASSTIFHVNGIEWINATSVKVRGGYIFANLGAEFCQYTVSWSGKQWKVGKDASCAVA